MAQNSSYRGLYQQVKNRSTSLVDKLKLVTFAWKSDQVYIPNKEQFVIDLLCGYLINKKKHQLTEEDVEQVWCCLCKLLGTSKAHISNKYGPSLDIKPSLAQVLVESILAAANAYPKVKNLKDLIGCCYSIITSPALSHIFALKVDSMMGLVSAITCLVARVVQQGELPDEKLISLFSLTLEKFAHQQKLALSQKPILQNCCDKLLVPVLMLWWLSRHNKHFETISMMAVKALAATLFHSDHRSSYSMYLNIVTGNDGEKKSQPPKAIENLFQVILGLRQGTHKSCLSFDIQTVAEVTSNYIPVMLESFLSSTCHDPNGQVGHRLFIHLCSLIGISASNVSIQSQGHAEGDSLRVLSQLLEVIKRMEAYTITQEGDANQLGFYQHLVTVLLNCKSVTVDWYRCLRTLLQLNHIILESKMTDILKMGWYNADLVDSDISHELDLFLEALMGLYHRLRQIKKLLDKILCSLPDIPSGHTLVTPPHFCSRYSAVIETLPQGMMLDLWRKFNSELQENFVNKSAANSGHLEAVCTLYHHFLLHVRVAESSVTTVTIRSVCELMSSVAVDILQPLLLRATEQKSLETLIPLLQLCYSLGELKLLLLRYGNNSLTKDLTTDAAQTGMMADQSYIHPYLQVKQWQLMYKFITKLEDCRLQYVWFQLSIQKLRAVIMTQNQQDHHRILAENILQCFLDMPKDATPYLSAQWNHLVSSITSENYLVAKWSLLSSCLPVLISMATKGQLMTVADFITKTSFNFQQAGNNSTMVTIPQVTREILCSSWFREFPKLHTYVLTCLLIRMKERVIGQQSSIKRRKQSGVNSLIGSLLDQLTDEVTEDWLLCLEEHSMIEHFKPMASLIEQIHDSLQGTISLPVTEASLGFIQTVRSLPLEYLSSTDKFRCVLCICTLLNFFLGHDTEKDSHSEHDGTRLNQQQTVISGLCDVLTVLIDASDIMPVFHVIRPQFFLTQIHQLLSKHTVQGNFDLSSRIQLLLEVSCCTICRDHQVFMTLSSTITKDWLMEEKDTGELIAACFVEKFSKTLRRDYMREEVLVAGMNYMKSFTSALNRRIVGKEKALASHDSIAKNHMLVKCYAAVLSYSCFTAKKKKLSLDEEVSRNFHTVLQWCLGVLNNNEVESHGRLMLTSLNFLKIVFTDLKLLTALVTEEVIQTLLEALLLFFTALLGCTSLDSTQSSLDDDIQDGVYGKHRNSSEPSRWKTTSSVDLVEEILSGRRNSSEMEESVSCLEGRQIRNNTSSSLDQHQRSINSGYCPSSRWRTVYRQLVVTGKMKTNIGQLVLLRTQGVMSTALMSLQPQQLFQVLHKLISDIKSRRSDGKQWQAIKTAIFVWQHVLSYDLSDEQSEVVVCTTHDMMMNLQHVLQQLVDMTEESLVIDISIPILQTQAKTLKLGPVLMSPWLAIMCLQSCQYMPLFGRTYVPAFNAVYEVLNELLVHHTETVLQAIPPFISASKRLLMSLVHEANQEKINKQMSHTEDLISCAYSIERLFTLIASHKVDFGKVSVYMIADYVTEVQQVTLLPAVKKALVPAIYQLLDICDQHAVSLLHTVLSQGVRDVFKMLYADYKKYHKYTGKI
ncbi:hypothetical protein CHS0354_014606 [Potamilus streckersoni]|uniref:Nucleolar 27S pre-rRNA processing Urb2/Npa2 C-terminal domain-containing protein n=1 Tax=Potamilus streckersoni TaxID=2493646 RepID=A0AAE0RNQ5_9BIVA|nr:hypothetical protein CHS0354_014606 [Potamilus streckersoni]